MSVWSVTPYIYVRPEGHEKTQDEKNLVQEIAVDILKEFFDNAIEICNYQCQNVEIPAAPDTHYTSGCCSTHIQLCAIL